MYGLVSDVRVAIIHLVRRVLLPSDASCRRTPRPRAVAGAIAFVQGLDTSKEAAGGTAAGGVGWASLPRVAVEEAAGCLAEVENEAEAAGDCQIPLAAAAAAAAAQVAAPDSLYPQAAAAAAEMAETAAVEGCRGHPAGVAAVVAPPGMHLRL